VARGVISVGEVETGMLAVAGLETGMLAAAFERGILVAGLERGILVAGLETGMLAAAGLATVDDCDFIESLCFLIASLALPYKFEACVVNVSHNEGELVLVVEEFIIITIQ
jgi:hypothetical protein